MKNNKYKKKTKKEIDVTRFYEEKNNNTNIINKIIFPHTIQVGLSDNSIYDATIKGSIQQTHEDKSYLVAGNNITINSSSNGQVTITTTPGGANTQVQFNDAGIFGGDADLTYNKTTNALQSAGFITASLGFSGSLTKLIDGSSYLIAGSNITIVSGSSGAVTISAAADPDVFKTISVTGQDNVVADASTDTLTLAAAGGMTITTNAGTDTVTLSSSDTNTQLTQEQVEDFAGAVVATGGTKTGIAVTYQDGTGDMDFVVADTTVAGDSGTTAITPGDTLTIAGGTNVTTAMSGDTLTITSTAGNTFSTIAVAGQSNVVADSATDTLTLAAGSNITLTTNAGSDTVTVAASGGGTDTQNTLDEAYDEDGAGKGAIITVDNQPVQLKVAGSSKVALAITGSVLIGSGSDGGLPGLPGNDTNFFVSGSKESRNTSERGTAVFGGDVHISGSLNKTMTTWSFYQSGTPGGDPTNEFHFEWASGTVNSADPEATGQNDFWQYFPKGGRILDIVARGGGTTNSSSSNPYTQRLVIAAYQWGDTWINSSENTTHAGYTPIGHITSSAPQDDVANEGGTFHHKSLYELNPTYFLNNATGSFSIPEKASISLTFKGIGSGNGIANTLFFVTVEKNL